MSRTWGSGTEHAWQGGCTQFLLMQWCQGCSGISAIALKNCWNTCTVPCYSAARPPELLQQAVSGVPGQDVNCSMTEEIAPPHSVAAGAPIDSTDGSGINGSSSSNMTAGAPADEFPSLQQSVGDAARADANSPPAPPGSTSQAAGGTRRSWVEVITGNGGCSNISSGGSRTATVLDP